MNSRICRPLYISFKSWLCCCSLPSVAPQQLNSMPLFLEYNSWRLEYLFWRPKKVEHCFSGVLEIFRQTLHHFIGEYPIGICIAQCSCSFSLVLVTKDEPQYKINRTRKLKLHCRKQCKKGKKKEIDNSL